MLNDFGESENTSSSILAQKSQIERVKYTKVDMAAVVFIMYLEISASAGSDYTFCTLSLDWYGCIVTVIHNACNLC